MLGDVFERFVAKSPIWTSGGNRAKTYGFAQQENLRGHHQLNVDFCDEFSCRFSARNGLWADSKINGRFSYTFIFIQANGCLIKSLFRTVCSCSNVPAGPRKRSEPRPSRSPLIAQQQPRSLRETVPRLNPWHRAAPTPAAGCHGSVSRPAGLGSSLLDLFGSGGCPRSPLSGCTGIANRQRRGASSGSMPDRSGDPQGIRTRTANSWER